MRLVETTHALGPRVLAEVKLDATGGYGDATYEVALLRRAIGESLGLHVERQQVDEELAMPIVVERVESNGPADLGGILPEDRLVAANGVLLDGPAHLVKLLASPDTTRIGSGPVRRTPTAMRCGPEKPVGKSAACQPHRRSSVAGAAAFRVASSSTATRPSTLRALAGAPARSRPSCRATEERTESRSSRSPSICAVPRASSSYATASSAARSAIPTREALARRRPRAWCAAVNAAVTSPADHARPSGQAGCSQR